MNSTTSVTGRLDWIDWMKTIGIYFIVLGHFFSIGEKFIYVFNVPLFFVISGFLYRKEKDNGIFWKKLWYNLIVPFLIMVAISFFYESAISYKSGTFELSDIFIYWLNVAIGAQRVVATCWFIYTLIVIKILYHWLPQKDIVCLLLSMVMLLLAFMYNHYEFVGHSSLREPNSIVNVCTAFPFFAIGNYLKKYKSAFNSLHLAILIIVFIVGLSLVYLSGKYNDYVWMYMNGFGGNMVWFLLGGIGGTICIYAISKLLGHVPRFVLVISKGTILILGFQMYFIEEFRRFFAPSFLDFVNAWVVVLLFVPVILLAEKYFPLILGKYRMGK